MTEVNNNLNNQAPTPTPAPAEEHHFELNAIAWLIVVIIAAVVVWFFVLGGELNLNREEGISQEVLSARMSIAEGNLGENPVNNVVSAFFLEEFPLSNDINITSVGVATDQPDYDLGSIEYASTERIADVKNIYTDWGENNGYVVSERNSSVNGVIVLDVLDRDDNSIVVVSISPTGRSNTKVVLTFPFLTDEPDS